MPLYLKSRTTTIVEQALIEADNYEEAEFRAATLKPSEFKLVKGNPYTQFGLYEGEIPADMVPIQVI